MATKLLMPIMILMLINECVIIKTNLDQHNIITHIDEHNRYRRPVITTVNMLCGLNAFCHRLKKASLEMNAIAFLLT